MITEIEYFTGVLDVADDVQIIYHLDISLVNPANTELTVDWFLIFFGKNSHDAVIEFLVKIICNFLRYDDIIAVAFLLNFRCGAGYQKFFETKAVKTTVYTFKDNAGKTAVGSQNSVCGNEFFHSIHIRKSNNLIHSDVLQVECRRIVRRIGLGRLYSNFAAEIPKTAFDGLFRSQTRGNGNQGNNNSQSYRKPANKDNNP